MEAGLPAVRGRRKLVDMGYGRAVMSVLGVLALASGSARADEIVLREGGVLEGKATRSGDNIILRMESGEISIPADSVAQVRSAPASEDILNRRYAALGPRDVQGRLQLATFCREHELRARERALLLEVIELAPDQPQARRRLGFVKTEHGWLDREAQLRDQQAAEERAWLARQQADELQRARVQAAAAERERTLALRELAAKQAELDAQRAREDAQHAAVPIYYVSPYDRRGPGFDARDHDRACRDGRRCELREPSRLSPDRGRPPFPIHGVRDPRDPGFNLPGFKDPRDSL